MFIQTLSFGVDVRNDLLDHLVGDVVPLLDFEFGVVESVNVPTCAASKDVKVCLCLESVEEARCSATLVCN